jgi:hypothetical protein
MLLLLTLLVNITNSFSSTATAALGSCIHEREYHSMQLGDAREKSTHVRNLRPTAAGRVLGDVRVQRNDPHRFDTCTLKSDRDLVKALIKN